MDRRTLGAAVAAVAIGAGLVASPLFDPLRGLSPVLDVKGGGKVTIARIDAAAPPMTFDVGAQQLARGSMYDLARDGRALAAGGTYRVSVGNRQLVFRVDPYAQPGRAPVVGRLLRL